jgi:hypothetical protein
MYKGREEYFFCNTITIFLPVIFLSFLLTQFNLKQRYYRGKMEALVHLDAVVVN